MNRFRFGNTFLERKVFALKRSFFYPVCALIGLLFLVVSLYSNENMQPENALRLHVVANSNSAEDQRVKLAVRDAMLAAAEDVFCGAPNKAEAAARVRAAGAMLTDTAEQTLRAYGKTYGARIAIGNYTFPDRTYGEKTYPAGEYDAVRVVLGDGAGENWWCVLFPPLCIGDFGESPAPEDGQIGAAQPQPGFRSLIVEWFERLKGGI